MIDLANANEVPLIADVWQDVFGDDRAYLDRFFARYAPQKFCHCMRDQAGALCGFLFLLPAEIARAGIWRPAHYLYGVCTLPAYRRQGVFRSIFEHAAARARKQGAQAIFSLPSDDRSRAAHRSLGFVPAYAQKEVFLSETQIALLERLRMAPLPLSPLAPAQYAARRNARPQELFTRLDDAFACDDFLRTDGILLGDDSIGFSAGQGESADEPAPETRAEPGTAMDSGCAPGTGYAAVRLEGGTLTVKESNLPAFELAYALIRKFRPKALQLCLPPDADVEGLPAASVRTVPTAVLYPPDFATGARPAFTSMLLDE